MSAPRVLSIVHAPHLGGPQGRNRTLARLFADSGAAHWTVALPDGPGAQALRAAGVDVRTPRLGRLRASLHPGTQLGYLAGWPGDVARLSALIQATRADVVLLNGLANPQGALAARRAGAAVVWQILDTRTPPALVRLLRPLVRAWADCVMTTGAGLAAQLGADAEPAGALAGRVVAFAPPVDGTRFRPDEDVRAAARAELGVSESGVNGRPVVGMVANLTPQKGHDAFLDAAVALRRKHPEVAFVWLGTRFAGQDAHANRLLERARQLGLADLIVRAPAGRVSELAQAFDLAWMTSDARSEGIPTAAAECMALGVPLLGFAVGALDELVGDGDSGLLLAPGDTDGLARASADLLADPARRAAMGAAGRAQALRVCDPAACAQAHLRAIAIARAHHARRRNAGRPGGQGGGTETPGQTPQAGPGDDGVGRRWLPVERLACRMFRGF